MSNIPQPPLFRWQKALRASDLAPSQRLVALMLSTYMSAQGEEAFPSVPTLAHDTGLDERTVRRAIRVLEAGGWLTTTERRNPRGDASSNRYVAVVPGTHAPTLGAPGPHHVEQSIDQHPSGEELRSSPSGRVASGDAQKGASGMKRKGQEPWGEGFGADPDIRPSGQNKPVSAVVEIREAFTFEFGGLDAPLYSDVGKMLANIKWLLDNHYSKETVLASFRVFAGQLHGLALGKHLSVWDAYFQRKGKLLQQAVKTEFGSRGDETGSDVAAARAAARKERHAAE